MLHGGELDSELFGPSNLCRFRHALHGERRSYGLRHGVSLHFWRYGHPRTRNGNNLFFRFYGKYVPAKFQAFLARRYVYRTGSHNRLFAWPFPNW